MKVMETVNVVIDESLDSSSKKFNEKIPKEILPPKPREVQETVEQELASPSTPDTPTVVENSTDISVRTYVIHLLGTYVNILCNWLIL